jgi:hypothetical protein
MDLTPRIDEVLIRYNAMPSTWPTTQQFDTSATYKGAPPNGQYARYRVEDGDAPEPTGSSCCTDRPDILQADCAGGVTYEETVDGKSLIPIKARTCRADSNFRPLHLQMLCSGPQDESHIDPDLCQVHPLSVQASVKSPTPYFWTRRRTPADYRQGETSNPGPKRHGVKEILTYIGILNITSLEPHRATLLQQGV